MTRTADNRNTQAATIAALKQMSADASDTGTSDTIETHAAIVFLVGSEAYKLKRAVDLGYLDFSTLEKREAACRAEIALNKTNAPQIYHDVLPVVCDAAGQVVIVGGNEPSINTNGNANVIDFVVRMTRFDQRMLFSELAAKDLLTSPILMAMARMVAAMHRRATPGYDEVAVTRLAGVAHDIAQALGRTVDPAIDQNAIDQNAIGRLHAAAITALDDQRALLLRRLRAGWVRRCHGDLHLRNLVAIDGEPVPFDALEFDDALATVDVLYDLAFLLMDLVANGRRADANLVLNTYLQERGNAAHLDALGLLPVFLALRAGIRAMVAADRLDVLADHPSEPLMTAANYLHLVDGFLRPEQPALYAIGGPSGTGKSTVARTIAGDLGQRIGAVHLRSDVIRKDLAGVASTARLPAEHYTREATARVYATLLERATQVLAAGLPVVVDAVFGQPDERAALKQAAARAGVPLKAVWLTADVEILKARVAGRTGDASDATVDVVDLQADDLVAPSHWRHVDAGGTAQTVSDCALAHFRSFPI